jgi:hypothetical protein
MKQPTRAELEDELTKINELIGLPSNRFISVSIEYLRVLVDRRDAIEKQLKRIK